MQTETVFAQEYTAAERLRILLIGAVAGAGVIFAAKTWVLPWFQAFVSNAPCRTLFGVNGLTVLWYGLFVGIPLHVALLAMLVFGWRGYKTLRDRQYPPAKEKVLRPTKIRTGQRARLIAYLHFSAFIPFLALAIWGGFQADQMSGTVMPKNTVCPLTVTAAPPRLPS